MRLHFWRRDLRVSDRWLAEHAEAETKDGWGDGTRWRSPAEIAQLRVDAQRRERWQRAAADRERAAQQRRVG